MNIDILPPSIHGLACKKAVLSPANVNAPQYYFSSDFHQLSCIIQTIIVHTHAWVAADADPVLFDCFIKEYMRWIPILEYLSPFMYSVVPLWCNQFSPKCSWKTPLSSPMRARYWVSFEGSVSDWYSVLVPAKVFATSCYIGLCCNGTRLYVFRHID